MWPSIPDIQQVQLDTIFAKVSHPILITTTSSARNVVYAMNQAEYIHIQEQNLLY